MTESKTFEDVFPHITEPDKFKEKKASLKSFVEKHKDSDRKIVLITSGGTTVPLESRTVRFIDNFSVGTRGSSSAEYFLQHEYAVIFLHRSRSLEPFSRHFSRLSILDVLQFTDRDSQTLEVRNCFEGQISNILKTYCNVKERGLLLSIEFISLADYLYLLRASCEALTSVGPLAVLYLAAAVSDFYIPKEQMPDHKIQSSDGDLQLSLQLVPKMLKPLVKEWVPQAFVISFKLETNEDLLLRKSQESLKKYQHQLVIANVLDTRKKKVVFVSRKSEEVISITDEEIAANVEIESKIIPAVVHLHQNFLTHK